MDDRRYVQRRTSHNLDMDCDEYDERPEGSRPKTSKYVFAMRPAILFGCDNSTANSFFLIDCMIENIQIAAFWHLLSRTLIRLLFPLLDLTVHAICTRIYCKCQRPIFIKLVYAFTAHTLWHIFAPEIYSIHHKRRHTFGVHTFHRIIFGPVVLCCIDNCTSWRNGCGEKHCACFLCCHSIYAILLHSESIFWLMHNANSENSTQKRGENISQIFSPSTHRRFTLALWRPIAKNCWHHVRTANVDNMCSVEFYEWTRSAVMCVKSSFLYEKNQVNSSETKQLNRVSAASRLLILLTTTRSQHLCCWCMLMLVSCVIVLHQHWAVK